MPEPLDSLVGGWKRHFASADQSIEWLAASERYEVELAPGVWLVGEIDARGRNTAGEMFFGEWKTANPREKKTWKQVWRMNPQSLSYGVLVGTKWPECTRFTVRKAFKELTPTYDHAWFKYSEAELAHWRSEIIRIAQEIRGYGATGPWPTNFSRCFRYGTQYACPFFDVACNLQKWNGVSAAWTVGGDPAWSATLQRQAIHATDPSAIVLSPSTIADWLDCREMYRRKYVELVTPTKNDALVLGGEFHDELATYYRGMVKNG